VKRPKRGQGVANDAETKGAAEAKKRTRSPVDPPGKKRQKARTADPGIKQSGASAGRMEMCVVVTADTPRDDKTNPVQQGKPPQSSAQKPSGPLSEKEVSMLMKALIHAPEHIQISTAKRIDFHAICPRSDLSVTGLKYSVDRDALILMPDDIPGHPGPGLFPIVVEGDGNCLTRVGSMLGYGTESYHLEIRLRIAVELILHKDLYLDEAYLSRGLPGNEKLHPDQIAKWSEGYNGQHLSPGVVEKLYCSEINQTLKDKQYLGQWQVFALSSVLNCELFSAYPKRGLDEIRQGRHRTILPRQGSKSKSIPPIVMWSSSRHDMQEEYWVANHFTMILPLIQNTR
jgi:hypothetical protein